jgi:hypothetical protein
MAERIMVVLGRDRELVKLAYALGAICGFSCLLDRWQDKRDENADDGDNDEQFDECEPSGPNLPAHGSLPHAWIAASASRLIGERPACNSRP